MAIPTTIAATNQLLPKAEIDIAALPCIKKPAPFFSHRVHHASPGVREGQGTTPGTKVQVACSWQRVVAAIGSDYNCPRSSKDVGQGCRDGARAPGGH